MIGSFACHFLCFLRVQFLTFRHVRKYIRLLSFCPHPFVPSPIASHRGRGSLLFEKGGEGNIVLTGEVVFDLEGGYR
jgi:hypothetical protein